MNRNVFRVLSVVVLSSAAFAIAVNGDFGNAPEAQAQIRQSAPGDMFYNFYVPPGPGGAPAQLYPCPRPTPPWVGHTWITYQPLMPHEFLWPHKRVYWTEHPGLGWTRTQVTWR
jgi:hypothetical protein